MKRTCTPWLLLALLCLPISGCLLPKGKPVIVDRRGGPSWSGDGILVARSDDGLNCRVALRATSLFVEKRWVPCKYVHDRPEYR